MSIHATTRVVARALSLAVPVVLIVGPLAGEALARPKSSPAPVFTQQPANPTSSSSASFAWTGTNNYTCQLDATRVACASSGNSWSYTTTKLAEGPHRFTVKTSGHKQNPASYSWRVDLTPPAAPSILAPPATTRATTAAISFTDSDPAVVRFACAVDGASAADCTSPFAVAGPLATGGHTVAVAAYDAAGNAATSTASWTVDPNAPDVPVVVGPATPTNQTSATVSFSTVNPASYTCQLDGAAATSCTSPATVTGLADGDHVFTVSATDTAGNTYSQRALWVVDTVAPAAPTLVTGPAALTDDTTPSITFSDTDPTGVHYQCTVTDTTAAVVVVPTTGCLSPWDLNLDPNTPDGHHFTAHIVPVDGAGNVGPALDVTWVLDQTITPSPALLLTAPSSPSAATTPTFTFDAPDYGQPSGATGFVCTLTGPGGTSTVSCPGTVDATTNTLTGSFTPSSPLTDGAYTLSISTTNGTAQSSPITFTWTVDTSAPAAPSVPNPGTTPNPTISFSDSDPTVTYTCAIDGGAAVACSSPWSPPAGLSDGTHTLVVTAVDAAGNQTAAAPVSFVVQSAPVSSANGGSGSGTGTGGATTPPATKPGSASSDTTAPVVSTFAAPTSLTGPTVIGFSENVTASGTPAVRIVVAGTSTVVPSGTVCLAGGSAAPCTAPFDSLRLTPLAALVPGQHYTVELDAGAVRDTAGNPSAADSRIFRATGLVEESSPAVRGTWAIARNASAIGHRYATEHLRGAAATWAFSGRSLTWWTVTGPTQGKASVLVDGVRKATVNNYAGAAHYRVARVIKGLSNGRHTLQIVVLGVKGAKSGTGTFVTIDAFTVGKTRTANPALTTTLASIAGKSFLGSRALIADGKGQTVSLTFRGTGITLWTMRSVTQGKVAAYIDGVLKATYDDYAAKTAYRVQRTTGKLADSVHTLKLVVLGVHHKGGKGNVVTVDRFTVA